MIFCLRQPQEKCIEQDRAMAETEEVWMPNYGRGSTYRNYGE